MKQASNVGGGGRRHNWTILKGSNITMGNVHEWHFSATGSGRRAKWTGGWYQIIIYPEDRTYHGCREQRFSKNVHYFGTSGGSRLRWSFACWVCCVCKIMCLRTADCSSAQTELPPPANRVCFAFSKDPWCCSSDVSHGRPEIPHVFAEPP